MAAIGCFEDDVKTPGPHSNRIFNLRTWPGRYIPRNRHLYRYLFNPLPYSSPLRSLPSTPASFSFFNSSKGEATPHYPLRSKTAGLQCPRPENGNGIPRAGVHQNLFD
ncbi:hypothetical protein RRG08_000514 [Elysia crispata]|uniref:Uncharacterized protein n=1 Tax=Elysia crispata TaxID=231223 RepID=A0AAE1CWV8_9GAST|nr:hypothetical protein RRG08_000514 [Elysia crispata]